MRVLTFEYGKLSIFARGIRKSKRRFAGNIEIFDCGNFEIKDGRGSLPILTNFEQGSTLRSVRENFDKLAAASLVCECIDLLVREEQTHDGEHEHIFENVTLTLQAIEEASNIAEICRAVYIGLSSCLSITGFIEKDLTKPPTKNNLLKLISTIENCVERQLVSKDPFITIFGELKKDLG